MENINKKKNCMTKNASKMNVRYQVRKARKGNISVRISTFFIVQTQKTQIFSIYHFSVFHITGSDLKSP